MESLATEISRLWETRDDLPNNAQDKARDAIELLDSGKARVAEIIDGQVVVNEWCKQAILLWFSLAEMHALEVGPFEYVDKVPLKSSYSRTGARVVPGAIARWGSFLASGVTLMPSYVNIGAYVGAGTMVDTWATVGSCAQIGERVHLSGGVGIGGVLEPPQAAPVVVEDDVFIGSRSIIVEGARVRKGAKLGASTVLTASTPVIDAETGKEISRGEIPERAVGIQASRAKDFPGGSFGLPCVLILRTLAEGEEHDKLRLNEILRSHGIAT